MSRISWLIVHIYSWSIRLYPASFREEFGVEMTSVFSDAITEATQANMRDLLIIYLRELRDYPFSLLRQHWHNFTHLEPNLMTTIKKPEWFFYPAWIILQALTIPIALFLSFAIVRVIVIFVGDYIHVDGVRHITEDYLYVGIFFLANCLLTGSLQYWLLRRYFPRMGSWLPVTAVGWLLGVFLIFGWSKALDYFWEAEVISKSWAIDPTFIVLGLSIGAVQWLLLRRRLPRAGWWIVANVVGWGLLLLITGDSLGYFDLLALSILPACVTAAMLLLLMNQAQPTEPQCV